MRRAALLPSLLTALAVSASAADPTFDAKGFDQNRDYFSELPYEHIDPMTGNLILTFTDLVLPGNAGFDLRIQRSYNAKIYDFYSNTGQFSIEEDSWAGIGWRLHLGRVWDPNSVNPGPIVEMADGSMHPTFLHLDGNTNHFITREHWTYEKAQPDPILRLPNGVTYTFGFRAFRSGRAVWFATLIQDAFGNRVRIRYSPDPRVPADVIEEVVQELGGGQVRRVLFTSGARGALTTMSFRGRTWTYVQAPASNDPTDSLLTEVRPPEGPAWKYGYEPSRSPAPLVLNSLTTPHGGVIRYRYTPQLFFLGSTVLFSPAVARREIAGRDLPPAVWTYEYATSLARNESVVASPCGVRTAHTFLGIGPAQDERPWAIGALGRKTIADGGGSVLEREELDWVASVPISNVPESGDSFQTHVPLLQERRVVRGGSSQVYRTTHTYDFSPYNRGQARNFNDYGRPFRTDELGELGRITTRAYFYPSGPDPGFGTYIVDKLNAETVQVGGEAFTKSYAYNPVTGFQSSQTIYGITTNYTPTAQGNVASAQDANNRITGYGYDWGLVSQIRTPEYLVTREINPEGTVRTEKRRGFTTGFLYDDLFRIVRTTPPAGNPWVTEYDNGGGTFRRLRRGPSATTASLDGFGRVVRTQTSVGIQTEVRFDGCGRVTYQSYPFGTGVPNRGTTFAHDALGRITTRQHPDGSQVSYRYPGTDLEITDEEGRLTRQDHSAFGDPGETRLLALTDAENKITRHDFNALGRLTRVVHPEGPPRTWRYNDRDQLESETHPENGTVTYTYDPAGNLLTRKDEEFGLSRFTYDGNNRLRFVDRPGAAHDTRIEYDESDNRRVLRNGTVVSEFDYDGANRLTSRTDRVQEQTLLGRYGYDGNDNLAQLDYPSGTTLVYGRDSENRITFVRERNSGTLVGSNFKYHPSGALASYRAGNGLVHQLTYDSRYRLDTLDAGGVLKLDYDYDRVGNVKLIRDARPGMNQTFDYDRLDRLTVANGFWGPGNFGYDALGNRRTKAIAGATTSYQYESATLRLRSSTGAEANSFAYDRNGNLREETNALYTYTPENLMESATVAGIATGYRYDGDNLRKLKVGQQGTRHFFHGTGEQLLSELEEAGDDLVLPVRDYLYSGARLLAAVKPSVLVVEPTFLTFVGLVGGPEPAPLTFEVRNSGGQPLAWRSRETLPWLSLSPVQGGTPSTVTASVNTARLAAGEYAGTVSIIAPGATGSPREIPVRLVLTTTPSLQVVPSSLAFRMKPGGVNPAAQTLEVLYVGGPVSFEAVSSVPWISLSAAGGDTPAKLKVSVDGALLGEGTHSGTITVTAPGAEGSPRTVAVRLTVEPKGGDLCPPDAFYCEPFDALNDGALDGQAGWHRAPSREAVSGQVVSDPRFLGKVLQLDGPRNGTVKDFIDLAEHPVEGSEVSLQLMVSGARDQQIAKIQLNTRRGAAWGKTRRTFAALRFGRELSLQHGPKNTYHKLVPQLDSGRWYSVRVRFVSRRIEVYIDGELTFTTANALAAGEPLQTLDTTAWDLPGVAHLDLIQVRPVETGGGPGDLVVEPLKLKYRLTTAGGPAATEPSPSAETGRAGAPGKPSKRGRRPAQGADALTPGSPAAARAERLGQAQLDETFGKLPLSFERGQDFPGGGAEFVSRGRGFALLLRPTELVLALSRAPAAGAAEEGALRREAHGTTQSPMSPPALVRMKLEGGRRDVKALGLQELEGKSHYLIGNDPKAWRTNVPHYAKVQYDAVYPGIDLVFHGNQRELEYDFVVAPGADPGRIRLGFEGVDSLCLDPEGNLLLRTRDGELIQRAPRIYQGSGGAPQAVGGRYVVRGRNEVGFELASYDRERALVIDPVLSYSTFLGGTLGEEAKAIAVDASGSAYVAGTVLSTDFPVADPLQAARGGLWDGFITKFDPSGTKLVYSTYLGGSGTDSPLAIAVDAAGFVSVAGVTDSGDFPLVNPYQATRRSFSDAFVARLNPAGSALVYSTYLGGSDNDAIFSLALDPAGNVYLTGRTNSRDFPLEAPFQIRPTEIFVTALRAAGDALLYSTYLGGNGLNAASRVAVDAEGHAFVTGSTSSTDFPTVGALQPVLAGRSDVFVSKFSPGGGTLEYSTYLGGALEDHPFGIAVDSIGSVYLTGRTGSADFPVSDPIQQSLGGSHDAFVTKLSPSGSALEYSTFLGGSQFDVASGIALDGAGQVHVTGMTSSEDFPLVNPFQAGRREGTDAFVTKVNPSGSAWVYSTLLGGNARFANDTAAAIVVDARGDVYVAGDTSAPDFPVVNAFQPSLKLDPSEEPMPDAFVTKIVDTEVVNSAGRIQLTAAEKSVVEKGSGEDQAFQIVVERNDGAQGGVSVDYATSDGMAVESSDYEASRGTVTFGPGQRLQTVIVPVIGDGVPEPDEPLTLTLSNPTGDAVLGSPTVAVLTIVDDDAGPRSKLFRIRDRSLPTGPSWEARVDVPWLSLDSTSGVGPSDVTATVSVVGLSSGTYKGTITVTANGAANSPQIIQVILKVLIED